MSTRLAGTAINGGRRGIAKGGDLDHYGNMYEQGKWGTGSSSVEELAKKYGLDRSQANSPNNRNVDDGHIWGKDSSGGDVYIGKASMDLGSNQSLIDSHSKQLYDGEVNHKNTGDTLNDFGDIAGALRHEWNGGDSAPKEPESDTFTYSDKVAKAKANVDAFEETMLPNQGDYLFDRDSTVAQDYADSYKLKLGEYQAPRNKSDGKLANPVNTQALDKDEEDSLTKSMGLFA